jgi:hypothetical protein
MMEIKARMRAYSTRVWPRRKARFREEDVNIGLKRAGLFMFFSNAVF